MFVTEGNEKADELAKEKAVLDEGLHVGSKSRDSSTRARRGVCSHTACSQLALLSGRMWKDCEELKPKAKEKWIFVNKNQMPASIDVRDAEKTAST